MSHDQAIRDHLLEVLRGGSAHATNRQVIDDFPVERVNDVVNGVPYTAWQLLEHMRRAQRDILDFMRDPSYEEPRWPDDYWPPRDARADAARWHATVNAFHADLDAVMKLVADASTDVFAPVPNGDGQTFLREFLLVADHNAYHLGELLVLRRALHAWPTA